MTHLDLWTIGGVLASIGLVAVIGITQWLNIRALTQQQDTYREEQKRQLAIAEHQKKLDSANLVRELNRGLRSPEFRGVATRIITNKLDLKDLDEGMELLRYINYISPICKLFRDGLILESDMDHEFSGVARMLDLNDHIRDYIEKHEDDYPHLVWYMDDVRTRRAQAGKDDPLS